MEWYYTLTTQTGNISDPKQTVCCGTVPNHRTESEPERDSDSVQTEWPQSGSRTGQTPSDLLHRGQAVLSLWRCAVLPAEYVTSCHSNRHNQQDIDTESDRHLYWHRHHLLSFFILILIKFIFIVLIYISLFVLSLLLTSLHLFQHLFILFYYQ